MYALKFISSVPDILILNGLLGNKAKVIGNKFSEIKRPPIGVKNPHISPLPEAGTDLTKNC
jgi:hypothetical protein